MVNFVLAVVLSCFALSCSNDDQKGSYPTLAWSYDEHLYPAPVYFRGKPIDSSSVFQPFAGAAGETPDLVVMFLSSEMHPSIVAMASGFGFSEEEIRSVAEGKSLKFKTQRFYHINRSIPPLARSEKKALLLPVDSLLSEFREDCVREVILSAMLELFENKAFMACKHDANSR